VSKYRWYAAAGSVLCSTAKKSGSRLISMNRGDFLCARGATAGVREDDATARNVLVHVFANKST
jgi:hypothetical protein